jgi:hypothetical protein
MITTKGGKTEPVQQTTEPQERESQTDLDRRYREIGISAVAAALCIMDAGKPEGGTTDSQIDERFMERAA